jgi:hypothetical protein
MRRRAGLRNRATLASDCAGYPPEVANGMAVRNSHFAGGVIGEVIESARWDLETPLVGEQDPRG